MSYRLRNFVVAAVLALLAGILTTTYVKGYKHRVQRAQDIVPVLVATNDIHTGTPAAKAHFAVRKVQHGTLVSGAVGDRAKLTGLVATGPIYAGEQITSHRFAPLSSLGPRGAIHGHSRLVALPGDTNQLLMGVLHAGDHVDVIAALPGASDMMVKPSKILLRNVLVVRPAQQVSTSTKLGSSSIDQKPSVLVAVADSDAQKLFFAMENGVWTLALRPIDGSAS